jgi:hypothetical protein
MQAIQEATANTEAEFQTQEDQKSLIELTALELSLVGGGSVAIAFV